MDVGKDEDSLSERLIDVGKTMIPVITGFLALVVATFDKYIERGLAPKVPHWAVRIGETSATFGVCALGAWCVAGGIALADEPKWTRRALSWGRAGLAMFVCAAVAYAVFVGEVIHVADR
jgi:hypothetical protein